jgi:hypothetical protein
VRRWSAVLAGVTVLGATPAAVDRLPTSSPRLPPAQLLSAIRASGAVGHTGYAESHARISLPDIPQIGRVVELLGGTSRLRVWWTAPDRWRVDSLTPIGEYGLYRDGTTTTTWDSFERRATEELGQSTVRLARSGDLLPGELGRRLAGAASPQDLHPLESRRVAGVDAAGVRIVPTSARTTVGQVDIWADPGTGLPLAVEVTQRGPTSPVISTSYLDVALGAPDAAQVAFRPGRGRRHRPDHRPRHRAAMDRFSPFVLPDDIAGERRRTAVGSGRAPYGEGFAGRWRPGAAVRADVPDGPPAGGSLTERVERPYGEAIVIRGPLLNGLVVLPNSSSYSGYVLSGAVPVEELHRIADDLAPRQLQVR